MCVCGGVEMKIVSVTPRKIETKMLRCSFF